MRNESISFFFDRTICQGGKNEAIDVLILRRLSIQSYMLFSLGKYSVDELTITYAWNRCHFLAWFYSIFL